MDAILIIDGQTEMIQIIQCYLHTLNPSITGKNVYCFSSDGEGTEILPLDIVLKNKKGNKDFSFRGNSVGVISRMRQFIREHKDGRVLVMINAFLNDKHNKYYTLSQYRQGDEYSDQIYMELLKILFYADYQKEYNINPDHVDFTLYSQSSTSRSLIAMLLREHYIRMQKEMEIEIKQNKTSSSRGQSTVKTRLFEALNFPFYSTENIYWCKCRCEEIAEGKFECVDIPLALPVGLFEYIKNIIFQYDEEKIKITKRELTEDKRCNYIRNYYHYTSISTAWAILENDSLRASHARFSNDSEELRNGMAIMLEVVRDKYSHVKEKEPLIGFLETLNASKIDSYIVCFCGSDDKLSQWRGYCRDDGVCFGFAFGDKIQYYFADNPGQDVISGKLQEVYYISKNKLSVNNALGRLRDKLQEELEDRGLDYTYDHKLMEDTLVSLIPLVKDPGFQEEEESRLVVINGDQTLPDGTDNPLDFLIQYRKDENGIQRPYINIRFGKRYEGIAKKYNTPTLHLCGISNSIRRMIAEKFPEYTIERKKAKVDPYILVSDAPEEVQKKALTDLEEIKKTYFYKQSHETDNISIWFEGHLPIRTITVSPCINQEEVIESFRHYCTHEKYWLKYVKVAGSAIPYRRPINR